MKRCEIRWSLSEPPEWAAHLKRVPKSNLLQTGAYAEAMRVIRSVRPRFGLIEMDGAVRGMLHISEASMLWGGIQAITLDRGPLWLDKPVGISEWQAFFTEWNRQFPKRFGRRVRVMPELQEDVAARVFPEGSKVLHKGYETLWLDIAPAPDEIRAGFKPKWRNGLNAAERAGLRVMETQHFIAVAGIIALYEKHKRERGYSGPSAKFLRALAHAAFAKGQVLGLLAYQGDTIVAAQLFILHGSSATYQVGWANEAGRKAKAHSLLLWEAILRLKQQGIGQLDLGGVNAEDAAGVTAFKEGLGGAPYKLIGIIEHA